MNCFGVIVFSAILLATFSCCFASIEEVCKTRTVNLTAVVEKNGMTALKNISNVLVTAESTRYLQKHMDEVIYKLNFFIDTSALTYALKGWNYLTVDENDSYLPEELKKKTVHFAIASDYVFPTASMFATLRRHLMCGKQNAHLAQNFNIVGTGKTSDCSDSIGLTFYKLLKKFHVETEGPMPSFKCVPNLSLRHDNEI